MKSVRNLVRTYRTLVSVYAHHYCEPLERRALLDASDPVIVLTEPLKFGTTTGVTSTTVAPWL